MKVSATTALTLGKAIQDKSKAKGKLAGPSQNTEPKQQLLAYPKAAPTSSDAKPTAKSGEEATAQPILHLWAYH